MTWRLVSYLVAFVAMMAVVVSAAACGGSNSGGAAATTTAPTASEQFAHDVCSSLLTWKQSVQQAAKSVKESPSKATISSAIDDTRSSTTTLVQNLKSLQVPDTQSATDAKAALATLTDQLNTGASKIKEAAGSTSGLQGSVEAASVMSSTLVTMRDQVKAAGEKLRGLPKGELKQAFDSSQACATLTGGTASSG